MSHSIYTQPRERERERERKREQPDVVDDLFSSLASVDGCEENPPRQDQQQRINVNCSDLPDKALCLFAFHSTLFKQRVLLLVLEESRNEFFALESLVDELHRCFQCLEKNVSLISSAYVTEDLVPRLHSFSQALRSAVKRRNRTLRCSRRHSWIRHRSGGARENLSPIRYSIGPFVFSMGFFIVRLSRLTRSDHRRRSERAFLQAMGDDERSARTSTASDRTVRESLRQSIDFLESNLDECLQHEFSPGSNAQLVVHLER